MTYGQRDGAPPANAAHMRRARALRAPTSPGRHRSAALVRRWYLGRVQGETALHAAICKGLLRTIAVFLERGGAPALQERGLDGMMPLHYAAVAGHVAVIRALLDARADVDATDAYGRRPAQLVSRGAMRAALQALLEDADEDVRPGGSQTKNPSTSEGGLTCRLIDTCSQAFARAVCM